ncbi:MAG TPA: phosphoenolpyruvate--protein phosphotransferase [Chitinivibrionales bacterium]|nr:phosphoenolpyruvate--protein phosphotransferase [Chitinivibrionales bacterium]
MSSPVLVQDLEVAGTAVSPGIAMGTAHHFTQIDLTSLEENSLPVGDIATELERLESALQKSLEQLRSLQADNRGDDRKDIADIFKVQIQILSDTSFLSAIRRGITERKSNIEFAIANQIRELEKKFKVMETEIFKSRLLDVQDVYHRLLRNILDIEHVRVTPLTKMPAGVILVAEQLLPSDIALIDLKKITGIVIESGSTVSHVSIIAKSLGVPAIINVPGVVTLARPGSPLILDGYGGTLIIRPSAQTASRYQKKLSASPAAPARARRAMPCATKDDVEVRLEANAGSLQEVREALTAGAAGIGLLRTELFYLSLSRLPTVEEETRYYRDIISLCRDKPLTIRLLDTGADKTLPYLATPREENPYLGVRGIRFLLHHPDILNNHLSAILRACKDGGSVRILVPFVCLPQEVDAVAAALQKVCKKEGTSRSRYSFGIMVELPAAAVSLGSFLDKIDFLSIGTNDLVQYAFAASRENSRLEEYRAGSFRVLLRFVKYIVDANTRHKKDITVCGEVASDPALAPYLIGLGVRTLSMQTGALTNVCREIEKKSCGELEKMAREYLEK